MGVAHAAHGSHGWEVRCTVCKKLKWPYLPEKPVNYVCTLCCGGVGAARQGAARAREASKGTRKPTTRPPNA